MSREENFKVPETAAVIGLGYVGLPTATLLASAGVKTLGVDINEKLLENLKSGEFKPKEPGLFDLLSEAVASGNLTFSKTLESRDCYIIAVPTPIHDDKTPGMEHVLSAAKSISEVIEPGQLVVLESTSPPGATSMVAREINKFRPDLDVSGKDPQSIKFAYCPERVLPGNAIYEIVNNERLVGGLTETAGVMAQSLYSKFTKGNILLCTDTEAEMAKLVENSFRDVNIAFANEIARISTHLGVQADRVIELANRHPRVNILSPGVGVGGHCISVDPWFLIDASPIEAKLIRTARDTNDLQPLVMVGEVVQILKKNKFQRVICLGLSYKPDSDDLRESPALKFVELLDSRIGSSTELVVIEPNLSTFQSQISPALISKATNLIPEIRETDLVIKLVDHSVFDSIDTSRAALIRISGRGQVEIT